MYDLIQYKTNNGIVEKTPALSTITELIVPYDTVYVDLTVILEKPSQDLYTSYSRAWSSYEVDEFNNLTQIISSNPYFSGYYLGGEYGLRINVSTDNSYISFKTNTAARPELAREGTFISLDNEWFVSIKKEAAPSATTDIDDPITFPAGDSISIDLSDNIVANSLYASTITAGLLYAESAYIRFLKSDSIFTKIISANKAYLDSAEINYVNILGGYINADSANIAKLSADSINTDKIYTSIIDLDSYVLGADQTFVKSKANDSAFMKYDGTEWIIEPSIKGVLTQETLENYIPKKPEHYFLSYDSDKGYIMDKPVIFGRFVSNDADLQLEMAKLPDGYISDKSEKDKTEYFANFNTFVNGENDVGYSTSLLGDLDAEKNKWAYGSQILFKAAPNNPDYSGILSTRMSTEYVFEATLSSTEATSGEIALVIAAINSNGAAAELFPIINTLSVVRKPRNYYAEASDPYFQDPYRLPAASLVYNYGLSNQKVLAASFLNDFAPAPTEVTSLGDDPDNWVSVGSTRVKVTKTCQYDNNNNPISTAFTISISDFGDLNNYYTFTQTIDPSSGTNDPYLEQFIGKVGYGFATRNIGSVQFSDIVITEKDLYQNEIIDLSNDRILHYVTMDRIANPDDSYFYNIGTEAGYYQIPYDGTGYNDLYQSNRLLYNEYLRKLYYIENQSSIRSPKVIQLGDPNVSTTDIKFEAGGGGFNNLTSPYDAYLKLNDEYVYPIAGGTDITEIISRGLKLTIFQSDGTLYSANIFDTWGDSWAANGLADEIENMSAGQIGIITSWDAYESLTNLRLRNVASRIGLIKLCNVNPNSIRNPYAAIFQKSENFAEGTGIKAFEATGENQPNSAFAEIRGYFSQGTFFTYGPENPNGLVSADNQYRIYVDSAKDVRIDQSLFVNSDGTFYGNLNVGESARIGTNLSVGQDAIIGNDLYVNHDAYVENTLHLQPWTDVGTFKGISWPADAFGGGGDNAAIYLVNGPAAGENYELTIAVANDKDSIGTELITDIINLSVPGDSATTNAKVNRQTIWHEGNYYLHIGNYIATDSDLVQDSDALAASPETIFNTWYRFSHLASNGFPANATELDVWEYDSINNSILCTKNSETYIGFISPETKDNFTLEATINSTDADDDLIALVIAFVIDSNGDEHTLSIGRTQNGAYTEPTQGWGLVYNQEQTSEVVLYEQTTTQTPGWNTSGGVRIGFTKDGPNLTIFSSQNGSTTYDPTLEYTINLDTAGYSMFSGANQYGFACCSQLNSTWTDISLSSTSTTNDGVIYHLGDQAIYQRSFFGDLVQIGSLDNPYLYNNRYFFNPTIKKFIYYSPIDGVISIYDNADLLSLTGPKIELTDLSVTTAAASGSGSLSYNNTSGVFTYTPADISAKIELTDLSAQNAIASGSGSLVYNNAAGIFTYSPPDLSSYLQLDDLSAQNAIASGSGSLVYNNAAGIFTYSPPDLSSYAQFSDLSVQTGTPSGSGLLSYNNAGVFTYTPPDLSSVGGIALTDLSVQTAVASGSGLLSYSDTTGIFTYTPPDLSSVGGIALTDLSAQNAIASGSGSLVYNNAAGIFTYSPPDLSSYAQFSDLSVQTAVASGSGLLAYNNAGVFTYTPPELSSYITYTILANATTSGGSAGQFINGLGLNDGTVSPSALKAGFTNSLSGNLVAGFDGGRNQSDTVLKGAVVGYSNGAAEAGGIFNNVDGIAIAAGTNNIGTNAAVFAANSTDSLYSIHRTFGAIGTYSFAANFRSFRSGNTDNINSVYYYCDTYISDAASGLSTSYYDVSQKLVAKLAYGGTPNQSAGYFLHNASANAARIADASYAVYLVSGTLGPFTGAHDGLINNNSLISIGDIVVDVDVIARAGISDVITTIEASTVANQKGVIGVFSGFADNNHAPAAMSENIYELDSNGNSIFKNTVIKPEYASILDSNNLVTINAVGEGQINVCGQGGNIDKGDLIVASDIPGKGMKQSDDIVRSYTVAKSRENILFDSVNEVKMIACIYLCG